MIDRDELEPGDLLATLVPLARRRNVLYTLFNSSLLAAGDSVVPRGTPVLYCGVISSSHILFHDNELFVYTDFEHLPITNVLDVVNRMKDAS